MSEPTDNELSGRAKVVMDEQRRLAPVADVMLRRLGDVVYNYLGTKDPDAVARWICHARAEVARLQGLIDGDGESWKLP